MGRKHTTKTFIAGIAWWIGSAFDRLKFLSERDALTKIFNRRFVYHYFPKLLMKVDKKKEKLSVFIVDINQFKAINDTYGHEKGDKALQQISEILLNKTRKMDLVARWGGDEFIVITPITDEAEAEIICKRIAKELQELSRNMKLPLSASIGNAIYPNDAMALDDLIRIADQNMYQMKASGK